jgi:uncharacterized protein (TIGR03084 family)
VTDLIADVRAEYEALHAFLAALPEPAWTRRTVFFDWTVADEVMHLHLVDRFGLQALTGDREAFAALVAEVRAGQAQGRELSHVMRERYGALAPAALLEAWRNGYDDLLARLAQAEPAARMPWFGPDMAVSAFAGARQMEVWAHGQDIYDLMRVRRPIHPRLRNICELGVRTQGWSFRNRGLERPAPPRVTLGGPDDAVWTWNDTAEETIVGPAEDFALVVTQRRHADDTALTVSGAGARRWMEIAQCFAGAPETGPAPGVRQVSYG